MSLTYEIRDPIHGCIIINEQERLLIDHPWVQRLRHIKQLGFVSVVYPGAVHDRFQHSLGVMHLSGLMFEHLCESAQGERGTRGNSCLQECSQSDRNYAYTLLRFAGILHDVGHAPFSHTSEAYFPVHASVALPDDWYRVGMGIEAADADRQSTHEDMTLAIIHRLIAEGVLEESLARDVAAVLSSKIRRSQRLQSLGPIVGILRTLISGELDADRCDYLLRDSHFVGVSYGVYDLTRLLACICVVDGPEHAELGLDIHGIHPLESLLLARYHMFLQVYFHKTPPAFEYFLSKAVEEGEIQLSLENGVDDVVNMRDDGIISQLHAACKEGLPWSRRILYREPAKLILRERLGADHQENFLADELIGALKNEGCNVFTRQSHQVFTNIAGAGSIERGQRLLCERRVLGRTLTENITKHSALLSSFNQPIDIRNTYVLNEDSDKACRVMDRLQAW
ncbi:MAG: HD domain-containing protein [Planctomycetes bacterium]|nr:HD domain-containing protein [Planctomycetota bacterium]